MGLQSFLSGLRKDEEFKLAQKQRTIQKILDSREKSNSERVLDSFDEEARQEAIKKRVAEINQQRTSEMFMGKFSPGRNIFKGHKSILTSDIDSLKSKNSNIMGRNIFFK